MKFSCLIFFQILLCFSVMQRSAQDISKDGSDPTIRFPGSRSQSMAYPFISPPLGWLGDITFVGQDIWVGGATGLIYKISSLTGQVLDSMDTQLNVAIDGIAYGNGSLWVAQSWLGHTILKIDPVTKSIQQTFTHPVASQFTHGMLFYDNKLWVNMFWAGTTDTTYVLDTLCQVIRKYPNHAFYSHGIANDGHNFWITVNGQPPNNSEYLFKYDLNFNLLDSLPLPGGQYPNGLAYDGRCLWLANADSVNIYKMCEMPVFEKESLEVEEVFTLFPNPAHSELNFHFKEPQYIRRIELYTAEGNLIAFQDLSISENFTLPICKYNYSMVLVRILMNDNSFRMRKVVLSR